MSGYQGISKWQDQGNQRTWQDRGNQRSRKLQNQSLKENGRI